MPAFVLILLSVLLNVIGQVFIKSGTKTLGIVDFAHSGIVGELIRVFSNGYIWAGLITYGIGTLFWISALSKSDLSYAYPFLALGYVLVIIVSYFLFKEPFTVYKVIGIALIVLGLIVISRK